MADETIHTLHELTTKVRVPIPDRFVMPRPAARLAMRVDTFMQELHPGHEAASFVQGRRDEIALLFIIPADAARQPILNKLNDAISEILS